MDSCPRCGCEVFVPSELALVSLTEVLPALECERCECVLLDERMLEERVQSLRQRQAMSTMPAPRPSAPAARLVIRRSEEPPRR